MDVISWAVISAIIGIYFAVVKNKGMLFLEMGKCASRILYGCLLASAGFELIPLKLNGLL